jgi:hypothetical protein
MKKFNGFEAYLILEGLKEVAAAMKDGIKKIEAEGRMPLMTAEYVDMVVQDTIAKVNSLTIKQK